ncbi:hypothetical protein KQI84_07035 [bacterium]|nr:hypothetical protein [bacterium]
MKRAAIILVLVVAVAIGALVFMRSAENVRLDAQRIAAEKRADDLSHPIKSDDPGGEHTPVTSQNAAELVSGMAPVLHHAPASEMSDEDLKAIQFAKKMNLAILKALALHDRSELDGLDVQGVSKSFADQLAESQEESPNYNWTALNQSASNAAVWDLESDEYADWEKNRWFPESIAQAERMLGKKPRYLILNHFQVEHAGDARNFLEFQTFLAEDGKAVSFSILASNQFGGHGAPATIPQDAIDP